MGVLRYKRRAPWDTDALTTLYALAEASPDALGSIIGLTAGAARQTVVGAIGHDRARAIRLAITRERMRLRHTLYRRRARARARGIDADAIDPRDPAWGYYRAPPKGGIALAAAWALRAVRAERDFRARDLRELVHVASDLHARYHAREPTACALVGAWILALRA